jgi:hypothetical protein
MLNEESEESEDGGGFQSSSDSIQSKVSSVDNSILFMNRSHGVITMMQKSKQEIIQSVPPKSELSKKGN